MERTQTGNKNTFFNGVSRNEILIGAVVLWLGLSATSFAQKLPMFDDEGDLLLSAQFKVVSEIARANTATPVHVPLIWRGDRLLNGQLHYNFYIFDPNEPLLKMVSPRLTLDKIPRELNTMIPAIPDEFLQSNVLFVDMEFIEDGNDEPFDLETHSMQVAQDRTAQSDSRLANLSLPAPYLNEGPVYTIAVLHSRFDSNLPVPEAERMWWTDYSPGILSQEKLDAREAILNDRSNRYRTLSPPILHPAYLSIEKLPGTAARLAGYDAVSLYQGVNVLNDFQLTALSDWVRVGGGVLLRVSPAPENLAKTVSFLKNTHASSIPEFPLEKPALLACDLGRVLLVPMDFVPGKEEESLVRPKRQGGPLKKGREPHPPSPVTTTLYGSEHTTRVDDFWMQKAYVFPRITTDTADLLAPSGLDLLPVRSIIFFLALFLLAAAPLDYFYLGLIRRRNLTWIVYPVAALICSWLVMRATEDRITEKDNGMWEIITLGDDGTALRREEFRLLLTNRHTTVRFQGQNELQSMFPLHRYQTHFRNGRSDSKQLKDWSISGNYPTNYSSTARLARLTPAIEHTEAIFPKLDLPDIDWNEMSPWPAIQSEDTDYHQRIVRLAKSIGPDTVAAHVATYFPDAFQSLRYSPSGYDKILDNYRFTGNPAVCIPCTLLTEDLACAAFTIQDGNRFTTYVRLFPKPAAAQ
ncbi:MAG: hypothetical protein R3F19_26010 [Verrucomicrobiales bacterium]